MPILIMSTVTPLDGEAQAYRVEHMVFDNGASKAHIEIAGGVASVAPGPMATKAEFVCEVKTAREIELEAEVAMLRERLITLGGDTRRRE